MTPIFASGDLNTPYFIPQCNKNPPAVACQRVDSPVCHIPGPEAREQQRQSIYQAIEEGRLFLREIKINSESEYLGSEKRAPRPFYALMRGVSVKMRLHKATVGIVELNPLACYKRNAATRRLVNSTRNPDELKVKCLPDFPSLQAKMQEQAERAWEIYPAFTSGHLHHDGTYRPPKLRKQQYPIQISHSEVLSSGYKAEQIKCVCIDKEDNFMNISDALQKKQELEMELGTGPLPLVVYSCNGGSLEVYFDDELAGNNLAFNEARLGSFSLTHHIAEHTFRELLSLLPMPLKSATLNRQSLEISLSLAEDRLIILHLVQNPGWHNYQRFQTLKNKGFPLCAKFIINNDWHTLLDLLSTAELYSYRNKTPRSDVAKQLFVDLFNSGVTISDYVIDQVLAGCELRWLSCYMKAATISSNRRGLTCLMDRTFPRNPAVILEFHQFCEKATPRQLAEALIEICQILFLSGYDFDCLSRSLLALFRYFRPDEAAYELLRNHFDKEKFYSPHKKRPGIKFAMQCIQWIKKRWQDCEQEPFYQNWPDLVQQTQQEMIDLRMCLGLHVQSPAPQKLTGSGPAELQFLADAFSVPPVLPAAGDNEATILTVLNHYYRRPGPERVLNFLGHHTLPKIWKPRHACNHVLRARINALWYMELLEKFGVMTFSDPEKDLLALATIYHDAAAEDVPKADEESKAAFYFKRDLAGQYPGQLLEHIGMALAKKEHDRAGHPPRARPFSGKLRDYLHVLRFADRLDVIRCKGVAADFPGLATACRFGFDSSRLDLPVQEQFDTNPDRKSDFQLELEAAMHGAADLVQVTGHLASDGRAVPYISAYQLVPDSNRLNMQFEWTPTPRQKMDGFVDNNVRRKIASRAGLHTCVTAGHKECRADTQNGRTWGIHNSWHDLNQVRIPSRMTLLEKMQFEHNEGLLSQATRDEIENEVARLRCQGIPMQLGTLTQTTLKSPAAKRALENRGIRVDSVKRQRGCNSDGLPREDEMLVPVYTGGDFGRHDGIT